MSEYFLADTKADERARQKGQPKADNVKFTLLGDFLFPSIEPQGCDPYNATEGKSAAELWRSRHERR